MATLTAIIEKGTDGGFNIYSPDVRGVYAPAPTETEAKKEFEEMLQEEAEEILVNVGKYPGWYSPDGIDIEYTYSLSGFFESFPFINASQFGAAIGINPSLMRRYKSGQKGVSKRQCKLIQAEFDKIVERLHSVRF